jgi:hypothetical protein
MSFRFFADHCMSNAIMRRLREAEHEVVRLQEHPPAKSPDTDFICKAQQLVDCIYDRHTSFFKGQRGVPCQVNY